MSIPVAIEELRTATARYTFAYLLTVSDDGRVHAVAVQPEWSEAGTLVIADTGRRTTANAAARPNVSLVWPPVSIDDYSLIADGDASPHGDGLAVTPTKAVMHRPAPTRAGDLPGASDAESCGSDCVPLSV